SAGVSARSEDLRGDMHGQPTDTPSMQAGVPRAREGLRGVHGLSAPARSSCCRNLPGSTSSTRLLADFSLASSGSIIPQGSRTLKVLLSLRTGVLVKSEVQHPDASLLMSWTRTGNCPAASGVLIDASSAPVALTTALVLPASPAASKALRTPLLDPEE